MIHWTHPVCVYTPRTPLVPHDAGASSLLQQVRWAADVQMGVPIEVLTVSEAGVGTAAQPHGRLQLCQQLAMRLNAKLGGVNVRLAGDPAVVGGGATGVDGRAGSVRTRVCVWGGGLGVWLLGAAGGGGGLWRPPVCASLTCPCRPDDPAFHLSPPGR